MVYGVTKLRLDSQWYYFILLGSVKLFCLLHLFSSHPCKALLVKLPFQSKSQYVLIFKNYVGGINKQKEWQISFMWVKPRNARSLLFSFKNKECVRHTSNSYYKNH